MADFFGVYLMGLSTGFCGASILFNLYVWPKRMDKMRRWHGCEGEECKHVPTD